MAGDDDNGDDDMRDECAEDDVGLDGEPLDELECLEDVLERASESARSGENAKSLQPANPLHDPALDETQVDDSSQLYLALTVYCCIPSQYYNP